MLLSPSPAPSPQDPLEAIAEQYRNTKSKQNKNEFKLKTYNRAVGTLKQLEFKVTEVAQLLTIVDAKGKSKLGKSVTETCTDILQSGEVGIYICPARSILNVLRRLLKGNAQQ